MIKLVGIKRLLVVIVLLGINLAVLAGYFMVLAPQMEDIQMQLRTADAQIFELSGKISNIKKDMVFLKENMPRYQALRDHGLFQEQDRFLVNRVLGDIRVKNNLSGLSFTIQDVREMPNKDADAIGYRLSRSRVDITIISVLFDRDIYGFMQDISNALPGHVYIKDFTVKRVAEVNEANLKSIADGASIGFVNSNFSFDWLTLLSKPDDAAVPGAAGQNAASPAGFRGR